MRKTPVYCELRTSRFFYEGRSLLRFTVFRRISPLYSFPPFHHHRLQVNLVPVPFDNTWSISKTATTLLFAVLSSIQGQTEEGIAGVTRLSISRLNKLYDKDEHSPLEEPTSLAAGRASLNVSSVHLLVII